MLKNYLLTAFRQMRRQTGTSLIHVVGLTLGIASSLLIFLTIWQEDSYDRYHSKRERVFRVETTQHEKEFSFTGAGTPTGVANALRNDLFRSDTPLQADQLKAEDIGQFVRDYAFEDDAEESNLYNLTFG